MSDFDDHGPTREQLTQWESITLRMLERAALNAEVCPSNLDIEMAVGANSTSVAPVLIRKLEDKKLIRVVRYQRFREVTMLQGNLAGRSTARDPARKTEQPHIPRGTKT